MNSGIATIWEHVSRALPDAVAVIENGEPTTYRQLDEAAGRLAGAWTAAGIGAGDRVGALLYNSRAYLETYYAAYKISAIPVNLNYRYRGKELAYLLDDADIKSVVFHEQVGANLAEALEFVAARPIALCADGGGSDVPAAIALEAYRGTADPVPHSDRPGTDRLFIYTGGTTGNPKAVVWTQGDEFDSIGVLTYSIIGKPVPGDPVEAARLAVEIVSEGLAPRTLPVAPLMHGTGWTFATSALCIGGTLVFTGDRSFNPASVWNAVERFQVSHLIISGNAIAAPLATELERAAEAKSPYDLSSVRLIASSGVFWSDDVKARLLGFGSMTLFDSLAASEGGPFAYATVSSLDDLPSRFVLTEGSRVIDDDGVPVEPGSDAIGVLAFAGSMPLGYHNDDTKTSAVYREIGGIRHVVPGDYVRLRADNSIEFLGRGSHVVNTGGEKVYTTEVEAAILSDPRVKDATVVGMPDPTWNQIVVAVVVSDDPRLDADDIRSWVGDSLAGYKKPREVVFVDELPRMPNGKLNVDAIKHIAAARLQKAQ